MADDDARVPPVPVQIPNSADEDVPPPDAPDGNGDPDALTEVSDPEAEHKRKVDLSKLRFAIWFSASTTTAAVALAVVEYFTPDFARMSNGGLDAVSDAMKFLATTSLGYIFGRSARSDDS